MELLTIITFFLWLPQALFQYLTWTYWIQVKEYRSDRFKSFMGSKEGQKKLLLAVLSVKFILYMISIIFSQVIYVVVGLLILLDLYALWTVIKRSLRRPVFTQRVIKIMYVGIISAFLVFVSLFFLSLPLSLLVGEIYLLIGPMVGVLITTPVVNRIKDKEIEQAKEILSEIQPKVIGITGSYGKTTTKDFLHSILKSKYKVEKTTKNENTVFGVVRKVIKDFPKDTDIFVAEMGAYKKGEINKLASITQPQIGMITGIEPQHLDLFGSVANIKKAKFELIESLPEDGVAVFNLSNEDTRDLYRKAKKELSGLNVLGYVLHKNIGKRYEEIVPDIESKIIESDENGVKFEVVEDKKSHVLFAPVTGIHFIENITGAILVARLLDLGWTDIENAVKGLELPERTMEVSNLGYGSILIDDSYNTTPRGFLSALNYLAHFKNKKRIVITPGIIELGERSKGIHKKIGSALSNKCDYVIVTNSEPAKYIKQGFSAGDEHFALIESEGKLLSAVQQLIENGTVILLEGRISSKVYDFIKNRQQ